MIPFIRSLSELMAITESRDSQKHISQCNESYSSTVDSGQRKRYINSLDKKEVDLPNLPKKSGINGCKIKHPYQDSLMI